MAKGRKVKDSNVEPAKVFLDDVDRLTLEVSIMNKSDKKYKVNQTEMNIKNQGLSIEILKGKIEQIYYNLEILKKELNDSKLQYKDEVDKHNILVSTLGSKYGTKNSEWGFNTETGEIINT